MTEDDVKILRAQTPETLAVWWCTLNRLEWPDEIMNPAGGSIRSWRIMGWIAGRIGVARCLDEWNRQHREPEL